jgi:hypothetical protein
MTFYPGSRARITVRDWDSAYTFDLTIHKTVGKNNPNDWYVLYKTYNPLMRDAQAASDRYVLYMKREMPHLTALGAATGTEQVSQATGYVFYVALGYTATAGGDNTNETIQVEVNGLQVQDGTKPGVVAPAQIVSGSEWKELLPRRLINAQPDGKVGVGTEDPLAKLDVRGTMMVSDAANFGSSVAAAGSLSTQQDVNALGSGSFGGQITTATEQGAPRNPGNAAVLYNKSGNQATLSSQNGLHLEVSRSRLGAHITPNGQLIVGGSTSPSNPNNWGANIESKNTGVGARVAAVDDNGGRRMGIYARAGFGGGADGGFVGTESAHPLNIMAGYGTKATVHPDGRWDYKNGRLQNIGQLTAVDITETSDRRMKRDIQPVQSVDARKMMSLRPVFYRLKDDATNQEQVGLIAQEVEKVYPELVNTDKKTGMKSLNYGRLNVYLLKMVQEQQSQIQDLLRANKEMATDTKTNQSLKRVREGLQQSLGNQREPQQRVKRLVRVLDEQTNLMRIMFQSPRA